MSSRQLRKLQKQRELAGNTDAAPAAEASSSEDDSPGPVPAAKPRVSLFAALGGDGDENGDDDDEPEEEPQPDSEPTEQQASQSAIKTSKKKKKKKKKAAKAKAQVEAAAENDDEDEIDKAILELKLAAPRADASTGQAQPEPQQRINELLSINTHHLRAINEMRQLFGREVIESAAAEEQREASNTRQRRGGQQNVDLETFLRGPPGMKKLPEVSLRRNVFIQGREHWPRATAGGLTMEVLEKRADGTTEYAYVHDNRYDAVQTFFFSCVQMGDPMRIVHLLAQVPYHVSTLLQVSAVAKQDQNMALSAELCERALFTFGRVATTAFRQDLERGKARLDFRRPENRQLWLAGYHYLRSLIRKGTYRTALEWAKLLFSFDHKDPYAMRHFLHFLAIRAYEGQWLVDFIEELERTSDNRDTAYLRQSLVLAKLQLKDTEGAKAELRAGIQRLPWLYCALYQELNLDAPPSIWGVSADTDARSFWTKLYVYQTKDLWNNTATLSLLQQVAKSLDKVETAQLPASDAPPDLGATRLAYLEGQTSIIAAAPREYLDMQPNYEFDPLPPPEEDNIFTGDGCRMPWRDRNSSTRAMDNQMEAQLRALIERQQARLQAGRANNNGQGGGAGLAGIPPDDEENAELDMLDMDDPELRQDLEEHARRANAPGIVQTLMRMLRGDGAPEEEYAHEGEHEPAEYAYHDDSDETPGEGPPGAWPS
ncbi:transcriptional repressor TCF25-domain-containing protein [Emericellopsis atlantica]|uniref:Transcriptional repressor TCF25-domain-containing protein n=1 Tax=Emericellopsis atlantica TaxID=2614577 RepID=A0A9P7ZTL3_9HYPO|nr:transcriptional repressor TCF25-domain-containing protein [Emericellopsis atlantica]KAG9257572.1 transcriptional repressor TCF25-domain-containing protein [Emericellopsis atlantica]